MKNQIAHSLSCFALVIVCAIAGTQTANAQPCQRTGLFGRFFRAQPCQSSYAFRYAPRCCSCWNYSSALCVACTRASQGQKSCLACAGSESCSTDDSSCLTDPVNREEVPSASDEYKPELPTEEKATEDDSALSDLERELIREAIRVRGSGCLLLRFNEAVNKRSQYNTQCQAGSCRLGHFSGDLNEIAGVGYGSARAAIQGWLNSPAHRNILLRANFTKVGACVRRGRDGLLYWTMNFGF